ncbi:putative cytochrome P450 49a1 [Ooceraea biroi]|uniref:Putative cytochrome P450 49a1 n=1 Tax=Ooceraea biroi TaxID=2015173 RepID=A0A026W4E1_OOCBI|nr:putative cytochrome P450 49a1 [Ooceraea biroi]
MSSKAMPLLETANSEIAPESFGEIPAAKVVPRTTYVDKTPLPFEEIPGPAILKLWEKYWRYVPLLGTQLFCSLLISRLGSQGRLSWNRNITPIKYLFNEYGCVVRINGPLVNDIVMIHRPEHIAEVFKQESKSPVRSGIDILQHYRLNHHKYRFAGPFSLQGSEWLKKRKKVPQPLHETISNHVGKLDMICDELINRIRNIRNRQDEVCVSKYVWNEYIFIPFFLNIFNNMDYNIYSLLDKRDEYMLQPNTINVKCFLITTQNKLQTSSQEERSVNEEKSSPLLEKMMLQRIHSDDISTLLMDMMILGVQAIVNCEAFLLYFLAKNPRVQRLLYDEAISVSSKTGSALTTESLEDMPYLKACVKESLRLRPAFPYLTRLLSSPITLHGYTIPKGTFVIMANEIMSQREELFEDPEKYRPERWLNQNEHVHQEYSYLPFGGGVRSCLGKDLAEIQMMLLTAKVNEFCIQ